MNALPLQLPGDTQRYIQSLVLSLLMHGLVIGAGLILLGDLHLAPQPEPFTWEVSVVEAPVPEHGEGPGPSPTPLAPSPTKTLSVEPQRATRPIQMVQPAQPLVHQEVRHEMREVGPVVQETAPTDVMPPPEAAPPVSQQAIVSPVPAPPSDQSLISNQVTEATQSQPMERVKPETTEGTLQAATPAIQEAVIREHPERPSPAAKPDYGWLAQALWSRIEQLKRYPHIARMNRWEGKVVLRAVIKEDGQLMELEVAESSGHRVLDLDALEIMRQASPLKLMHALGQPQVVVQVPISYRLEH